MDMYINGVKSSTVSGFILHSFQAPIPTFTEERVQIINKSGTTFLSKRWNDRDIKVSCLAKGSDVREVLRKIFNYLNVNNEIVINFTNDPEFYFIGRFNHFNNLDIKNPTTATFEIVFQCEPEYYKIINLLITPDLVVSKAYLDGLVLNIDYKKGINIIE